MNAQDLGAHRPLRQHRALQYCTALLICLISCMVFFGGAATGANFHDGAPSEAPKAQSQAHQQRSDARDHVANLSPARSKLLATNALALTPAMRRGFHLFSKAFFFPILVSCLFASYHYWCHRRFIPMTTMLVLAFAMSMKPTLPVPPALVVAITIVSLPMAIVTAAVAPKVTRVAMNLSPRAHPEPRSRLGSLVLFLQILLVASAALVLIRATVRYDANPRDLETVQSASFRSLEPLSPSVWTPYNGTWSQGPDSLQVRQDDLTVDSMLIIDIPGESTKLQVDLANQGTGGGVVLRFVDPSNYFALVNFPGFGGWSLIRVQDGERVTISESGSIVAGKTMTVEWNSSSIIVQTNASDVVFLDDSFADANGAGLLLIAGGDEKVRWGSFTVFSVPASDSIFDHTTS